MFGLVQLWLLKRSIDQAKTAEITRNNREALTLTAELADRYATKILPMSGNTTDTVRRLDLQFSPWPLKSVELSEESLPLTGEALEWTKAVLKNPETRVSVLNLLNHLEGFALFFIGGSGEEEGGVADEAAIYPIVGDSFRNDVASLAPILIALRSGRVTGIPSGGFHNVVELYRRWENRAKKSRLQRAQEAIGRELEETPDTLLPPIGTKGTR